MIGLWGTWDAGESDLESSAFFDFLHRIRQFPLKINLAWRQCQGLVQPGPDLNHPGDALSFLAPQIDITRREIDGNLDQGLYLQMNHIPPWIVRINFGAPAVGSLVTFCPYPNGYLSLPAGGDTPVKGGNGTASARSHSYYLECLITMVEDLEGVSYYFSFFDFFEIE